MAASGKKTKKNKGKTFSLTTFLSDGPGAMPNAPPSAPRKSSNWADDVDEEEIYDLARKEKPFLPTAPRSTRINDSDIPMSPPYLAYISNLPYEGTEEEISNFFKDMKIANVRLPRDDRQPGKLKGFGYVEFEDRASLFAALSMSDQHINGRRIRIEVADNNENDRGRGGRSGGRMDRGRDRMDGPDRTMADWRSGPRSEPPPDTERDRGYGGFDRRGMNSGSGGSGRRDFGSSGFREHDSPRDGGGFRDRDGGGFRDRDGGGFRDRDGGGFRDRDRDGGFRDRDRGFRDGGGFRDSEGYGRYDRDRDSGFGNRGDRDRDFGSRSGPGPRRSDFDRDSNRPRDDLPPPEKSEPKSRPKLNLKPRTKPLDEVKADEGASQASIFGGAKPVDTAAREKEIEERLAREKSDLPRGTSRLEDSRRDDRNFRHPQILLRPSHPTSSQQNESKPKVDDDKEEKEENESSAPASKFEPAPAPKENVWARQQPPPSNSHQENSHTSPPVSDHESDRSRQQHKEEPRKKQPPQNRPRTDAGDQRRHSSKDERVGGGARSKGTTSPTAEKPQRREKKESISAEEELLRMPKYKEHEIPNFAGDNKFAYLSDEDSSDRE